MNADALALHVLGNEHGDCVELLNLGARIHSLKLHDRGRLRNVVLSHASPDACRLDEHYLGATIGRYANRIRGARFELDGKTHALVPNDGANQLHGGPAGFDRRVWHATHIAPKGVRFELVSEDGDQGFPGTLRVAVEYRWLAGRTLLIELHAVTDRPTPVSLTNHAYFNLDGHGTVLGHRLAVAADAYLATDSESLPVGGFRDVAGDALDLREPRRIGGLVAADVAAVRRDAGLDLCYRLRAGDPAARLESSSGDLALEIATSYPALQVYTGQYLRAPFEPYAGICLEAQYFPDSPNRSDLPSTILRPGFNYVEWIRYQFEYRG
jgi:aldose 1-epimerase